MIIKYSHIKQGGILIMEKEKQLPYLRIAGIMLGAILLMVCVISGTMAKYKSTAIGSATVTVAKWSVEVNGTDIAKNNAVTFDLFKTINEADNQTPETNVVKGKIAPGTGGSFSLTIENKSEVDATYSISLSEINANNIPIEYSTDEGKSWGNLSTINMTDKAINIGASDTLTGWWRWRFNGNDAVDTALGTAEEAPIVEISAQFTVEQVN